MDPRSPRDPSPPAGSPAGGPLPAEDVANRRGNGAGGVVRPAIVYALLFGAAGAYLPYVTIYLGSKGLDLGTAGLLIALHAAISLVAAPGWGALTDGIGDARAPLLAAGILSAAAAATLATAVGALPIALAIILLATASAGMIPMVDSQAVRMVSQRDRVGEARAPGSAAFIVVAILTGIVMGRVGAGGVFLLYVPLLGLTGLGAWVLFRPLGPRSRASGRERPSPARFAGMALGGLSPTTIGGVLRQPGLGVFFVASVAIWSSHAALQNFVSVRIIELGGDASLVGTTWSLGALVEVPLMFVFPRLARRFGAARLIALGAVGFAGRALVSALVTDPALILLGAPFGGVGFAFFYIGTVSWIAGTVRREIQATAQGLFTGTALSLGAIGGSIAGGLVGGGLGLPVLFGLATGGYLLGGLLVWVGIVRGPGVFARSG